ncbi:MAG: ribosomal protein L11 methyltransferase [Chlamydiales bacterium]|jgi:ribosomal protein L11 methyltransferase
MTELSDDSQESEAWVEVRVVVPLGWHELVAEALAFQPCTSVAFGRTNIGMDPAPEGHDYVRTFYGAHFDGDAIRARVRARLARLAGAVQVNELENLEVIYRTLPAEDFATSWKKTWRPFRVGRICVLPPDFEYELRPNEHRLTLEPGGVFGTGRHATTRTALRVLQSKVAQGDRVIDAGAGTGILGVGAALLGAGEVYGFDIDPNSPKAAALLARRSGVADTCTFTSGGFELLQTRAGTVDGLLANIYADILQEYAPAMAGALRPGGWFVFSGCLDDHAAATRTALESAGLHIESEHPRGRWYTLAGRKRS